MLYQESHSYDGRGVAPVVHSLEFFLLCSPDLCLLMTAVVLANHVIDST